MKIFGLFGNKTQYRSEVGRTPESLREIDTDRALELLPRLPEVATALAEFSQFAEAVTRAGRVANDAQLLEEKRLAVVAALAAHGYRLGVVPGQYDREQDESVEELARLASVDNDLPLAA